MQSVAGASGIPYYLLICTSTCSHLPAPDFKMCPVSLLMSNV